MGTVKSFLPLGPMWQGILLAKLQISYKLLAEAILSATYEEEICPQILEAELYCFFFHSFGIFPLIRHVLKTLAKNLALLMEADFQTWYGTPSGPGLDCHGRHFSWTRTSSSATLYERTSSWIVGSVQEMFSSHSSPSGSSSTAGWLKKFLRMSGRMAQNSGFSPRIFLMHLFRLAQYHLWIFLA